MPAQPKGTYIQQAENLVTSKHCSENVTVISPFLTEKEMCAILKISKNTLYRRVDSKQIKKVVVGGCVRYPIKENKLEKYLV